MRKIKAQRSTYCPTCGRLIGVVTAPKAPGEPREYKVATHTYEGVRCVPGTGTIVPAELVMDRETAGQVPS